jgi:hypothetical protein
MEGNIQNIFSCRLSLVFCFSRLSRHSCAEAPAPSLAVPPSFQNNLFLPRSEKI